MASSGNQHCANCIGTLSFPICAVTVVLLYYMTVQCARRVDRRKCSQQSSTVDERR